MIFYPDMGFDYDIKVGIDLEEVKRFRKYSFPSSHRFWKIIFNPKELERVGRYRDPYPHLAGIFVAKEAIRKALFQLGVRSSFRRIKIQHARDGRPRIEFGGGLRKFVCEASITHTKEFAAAVAICKKHEYRRNKRKN